MLQKESKEVVNSSGECEEGTNNDFADGHFQTMILEGVKLVNTESGMFCTLSIQN